MEHIQDAPSTTTDDVIDKTSATVAEKPASDDAIDKALAMAAKEPAFGTKRIKKLSKQLREIRTIEAAAAGRQPVDASQRAKLAKKQACLGELIEALNASLPE